MSEPTFVHSAEVCLTVCLSDQIEHNGMRGERKHMVELYSFVAHAKYDTTRVTNVDRTGRKAREGSEQCACRLKRDRE